VTETDGIVFERDGRLATITLNRPHDQNRLTREVLLGLQAIANQLRDDDIRLAASHATFALPEARWGGFPGAGGPVRLPGIVGRARALEIICTGRELDAGEMERIGLVLAVHPFERLAAEARALAERIAESGPLATRGAKRIMTAGATSGFAAARALSDALRQALEWSRDVDEGLAAHREGRPPRFTGR
jgi:enoyl-CoA hydratase/carnithine racemase